MCYHPTGCFDQTRSQFYYKVASFFEKKIFSNWTKTNVSLLLFRYEVEVDGLRMQQSGSERTKNIFFCFFVGFFLYVSMQ